MPYIFFDLDETLTDHKYACKQGIEAIADIFPGLRAKTVEQLEYEFWRMLNGNYSQVLNGTLSMNDTRMERIAALFRGCNCDPPADLTAVAELYVSRYNQSMRAIPGMTDVLSKLNEHNYKVVVITNGFKKVQFQKLEACNLTQFIAEVITSEEVGAAKPDPKIYLEAFRRCIVLASQITMIGDSWENDIECAHALGMKTIWLNRRDEPCPDAAITHVIFEPIEILNFLVLGR